MRHGQFLAVELIRMRTGWIGTPVVSLPVRFNLGDVRPQDLREFVLRMSEDLLSYGRDSLKRMLDGPLWCEGTMGGVSSTPGVLR